MHCVFIRHVKIQYKKDFISSACLVEVEENDSNDTPISDVDAMLIKLFCAIMATSTEAYWS